MQQGRLREGHPVVEILSGGFFAKAEKVGANSCRKNFENRTPCVFFRKWAVSEVNTVGLREDGIEQSE